MIECYVIMLFFNKMIIYNYDYIITLSIIYNTINYNILLILISELKTN